MSAVVRRVSISGQVQGVGYRYWTEQEADSRRLEGWVRNHRDGSVEAVFAGPAETVLEMIARCRTGPAGARVDEVDEQFVGAEVLNLRRAGERFSVLPTV